MSPAQLPSLEDVPGGEEDTGQTLGAGGSGVFALFLQPTSDCIFRELVFGSQERLEGEDAPWLTHSQRGAGSSFAAETLEVSALRLSSGLEYCHAGKGNSKLAQLGGRIFTS